MSKYLVPARIWSWREHLKRVLEESVPYFKSMGEHKGSHYVLAVDTMSFKYYPHHHARNRDAYGRCWVLYGSDMNLTLYVDDDGKWYIPKLHFPKLTSFYQALSEKVGEDFRY